MALRIGLSRSSEWISPAIKRALLDAGHEVAPDGPLDVVVVEPAGLAVSTPGQEPGIDDTRQEVAAAIALAHQRGARRVILLSGIDVVGPRAWDEGPRYEGCDERPVDDRGRRLAAAEAAALECRNRLGVATVILRAGHLYGPGHVGALQEFVDSMERVGPHPVERLPLHVEDLAQAVVLAVEKGDWIYHVTPLTRQRPKRASAHGRVYYRYPPHRAMRELGYQPTWTIERGVVSTLPGGLESLSFSSAARDEGDVLRREGRFWDEEESAQRLIYEHPHDWAFDVPLGNVLQAPTYRFFRRIFRHTTIKSVLDLGCGSGVYSRNMAIHGGVRVVGIDLSEGKIATARQLARDAGVEHITDYRVANALDFTAPAPVDAICAFGALHHFPDLEKHLPGIVARNLKPHGLILAAEPHHEGYHPKFIRFMNWIASSRLRRLFEVDRYEGIAAAVAKGSTLLGESPAGLDVLHAHFDLDRYLRSAFDVIDIRYTHFLSPFFANAFVVYQRSRTVAACARALTPAIVRLDGLLCRWKRYSRWAALGLYALRARDPSR